MAENSKIEWTHHTANLWWGCTKVHAGCDHCYAETLSHRWGYNVWGNETGRRPVKTVWNDLTRYQNAAAAKGEVHRVFVGSMMDIFEKAMPLVISQPIVFKEGKAVVTVHTTEELRNKLFYDVIPNSPNLMFLLLTKRPSNINKMIPPSWKENPPKNVMFGCSPVDQETADKLIPQLLEVAGKKFLSIEPMLGEIRLKREWMFSDVKQGLPTGFSITHSIDWIICGGESGPGKRPFNPEWARLLAVQCSIAKVPFFMKQWDKIQPIPEDLMIREFPYCFEDYELNYGRTYKLMEESQPVEFRKLK